MQEADLIRSNIKDVRDRLDDHISKYDKDSILRAQREDKLLKVQEANTECITALISSTQGLVDAWNTANALRRFFKWLSGFAIIGSAAVWIFDKLYLY